MDSVPKLPERYLEDARRLTAARIVKKNCKLCFGRGYRGTNQNNMLVTCGKCVDEEALFEDWKAFVRQTPELSELYGDYYEDEETEQEADGEADGDSPADKPS